MSGLNKKQQRFADEYVISLNPAEAYIKAGYSPKFASVNAQKLLKSTNVEKYIQDRMEELQDDKILTQKEILVMLSEIASGQAKEYKDVVTKKGEFVENPNTGKKQLVYNESSEVIELPTKNSDRNRALELLGKRYAMWTDKQQLDGDLDLSIVVDYGDED